MVVGRPARFGRAPAGRLSSTSPAASRGSGARSSTDRASDYGSEGLGFESLRARNEVGRRKPAPHGRWLLAVHGLLLDSLSSVSDYVRHSNTTTSRWEWITMGSCLSQRLAAVVVAATSMMLVGCGSEDSTPTTVSPRDGASASAPEVPSASEAAAGSPLEGRWQAGPVSLEETEATLRRHGLDRWVEDYRANAPFFGRHRLDACRRGREVGPLRRVRRWAAGADRLRRGVRDRRGHCGLPSLRWLEHLPLAGRPRHPDTPLRPVDAAPLPGDPGRSVPTGAVHDRGLHEGGLDEATVPTSASTSSSRTPPRTDRRRGTSP